MKTYKKYFYTIFFLGFASAFFIFWWAMDSLGVKVNAGQLNMYASKILIMTAVCLLGLEFSLATRLKAIERVFGGLDVLYKVHGQIGRYALVLILAHPILLSISYISNSSAFFRFYLPSTNITYNFGIFALWMFSLLVVLTIFIKMPYHLWKLSHRFMGLPILFVLIHVALTRSYISDFMPFKAWLYFWIGLAIVAYIYKLLFYKHLATGGRYVISQLRRLGDHTEAWLQPSGNQELPEFLPGRYVFLSVLNHSEITAEPHPYSISSIGDNNTLRLTIKALGDHSGKLQPLKTGDKVELKGPYGSFDINHPRATKTQIWLGGGVGVTPFLSMLQAEAKKVQASGSRVSGDTVVHFFYATKIEAEAVYDEEVSAYAAQLDNLKLHKHYSDAGGFMTGDWIIEQTGLTEQDLPHVSVLQCGPPAMMQALEKQLVAKGVAAERIIYEDFALKPN